MNSGFIRRGVLVGSVGSVVLALTACGGSGGGDSAAPSELSVLVNVENDAAQTALTALSEGACQTQNETLPLSIETVPQTNLDQQLQLLGGQGGLPVLYSAGNAPALTKTLDESGSVADFQEVLTGIDAIDNIQPAAISTIEALYGGFKVLPFEYNVEGIWYNKQIFAENNIAVPETWEDLVSAAETLDGAGVQPFSASGEQGWPITRLVGNYLFRSIGPDALQAVADGEASLTDPEYVEAAQAVADLGAAGYFGEGVGSIDYDTATNQFLNGSAAMFYMGSWALSDFSDEARAEIGYDNIGYMPFPNVDGGEGDSSQIAANVGLPITMNATAINEDTESWLGCIAENYGSVALSEADRISGFVTNEPVADLPALTQEVQERVDSTEESVLWFEALFSTQATTSSQTNAASLVTGGITPEDFMALVQADLE